ncbi:Ig-like domain-containing protein [Mesobacillus foraminis]|uniref:Ig-like domain-containing protein n=1 Tax=Mesobacillus foraminis TaxID=279826 RepID=UPI000EF46DCC|nr:Ig-like domain-containing protein [Mesobacillus foraminis]
MNTNVGTPLDYCVCIYCPIAINKKQPIPIQSPVEGTASKPTEPVLLGNITDQTTIVAGWAEKGSTVKVKNEEGSVLGSSVAEDGTFQVKIPAQSGGTVLAISSTNSAEKSSAIQSTVEDTTNKPADPVLLDKITDQTTMVAGWAEKGSTVQVKNEFGTVIGSSVAEDGTFQVKIAPQTNGTLVTITSTNSAKKSSEIQTIVEPMSVLHLLPAN